MAATGERSVIRDYFYPRALCFWAVHVFAVYGVVELGWSWSGFVLALALYYARMFFITAGFHRYFAHRTFKTSRIFQFVLAFCGTTSTQKGVLWWAANHRHHHRYSDQPEDIHSPVQGGFWWSQVGWILANDFRKTRWDLIPDMAKYPELRLLNRFYLVPPIALAATLFLIGGFHALVWGFFVSTVVLWHGTFTINSLSHVFGRRRYDTTDDSRNNWFLALVTMGEGWHNNHHYYMNSANQGFRWYEIDMSFYIIKMLEACRIVSDVRKPPAHVIEGRRRRPKKRLVEGQMAARPQMADRQGEALKPAA
jgi:stearoyl-CoA desaturase (delta-9 desaturase)